MGVVLMSWSDRTEVNKATRESAKPCVQKSLLYQWLAKAYLCAEDNYSSLRCKPRGNDSEELKMNTSNEVGNRKSASIISKESLRKRKAGMTLHFRQQCCSPTCDHVRNNTRNNNYAVTRCSSKEKIRITTPTNPRWMRNCELRLLPSSDNRRSVELRVPSITENELSVVGEDRPPTPYPFSNTEGFLFK